MKLPQGWGWPHKAHFVPEDDDRSLCGRWGFFQGTRQDDRHDSPDNCALCKRKRPKDASA